MKAPRVNLLVLRIALAALAVTCFAVAFATADDVCCAPAEPVVGGLVADTAPAAPSWIFRPSTFTHDPMTGARVAQYMRKTPVEPLDDERAVTSGYRRTRTNLRGTDGSIDSYYQVQAWNNGRGGLDAEWERFHDAWKESILSGGSYNEQTSGWGRDPRWNRGWNGGWNNWNGGWGGGAGWGSGWGGGWNNGPGWNGGTNWNPGWNNGPGWGGGGWNNGHGNHHHGGGKDKKVDHHGGDDD